MLNGGPRHLPELCAGDCVDSSWGILLGLGLSTKLTESQRWKWPALTKRVLVFCPRNGMYLFTLFFPLLCRSFLIWYPICLFSVSCAIEYLFRKSLSVSVSQQFYPFYLPADCFCADVLIFDPFWFYLSND